MMTEIQSLNFKPTSEPKSDDPSNVSCSIN